MNESKLRNLVRKELIKLSEAKLNKSDIAYQLKIDYSGNTPPKIVKLNKKEISIYYGYKVNPEDVINSIQKLEPVELKHKKWSSISTGGGVHTFTYDLQESKLNEYSFDKAVQSARVGAKATGGGYSPFTKIRNNAWKNMKTGRLVHDKELIKRLGGFDDFEITESKLDESGILYKAGVKKYGKEGMKKIQQAAGKGEGHEEIGKIKDKFEKGKTNEIEESTEEYGKSLKKIALDKQLKMLSAKDKATLLKIADLMKRANEGKTNEVFNPKSTQQFWNQKMIKAKTMKDVKKLYPKAKPTSPVHGAVFYLDLTGEKKLYAKCFSANSMKAVDPFTVEAIYSMKGKKQTFLYKEGKLTEALARGLKPLLKLGSKVGWNTMSEDALLDLSDKFDRINDEDADSIASHLNMSIELRQDGYKGDATKAMKQFNKVCADVLKGKPVTSVFEGKLTEGEKYITNKFKVGDTIKLLKYNWKVTEINFKPGKSYRDSFTFVNGKQVSIKAPPTNKNAVGYKIEDGNESAFYYCYKAGSGKTIMKLAIKGFNESVTEGKLNEMEMNDPILIAVRARKQMLAKEKAAPKTKKISTKEYYKLMDAEIDLINQMKDATKEYEQLDSDMNAEAGQKGTDWSDDDANRYGADLDKLQTKIEKLAKQKLAVKKQIMNYRIN